MPKMVEVDEEQLLQDQRLRQTLSKIMSHPKAKLLAQQAHKLVDPSARTPDLDQQSELAAPIHEIAKKVDAFITAQQQSKEQDEIDRRLAAIKQRQDDGLAALRRDGWTNEGIEGVKKVMDEKGILDPLDAAAIFEKAHPPQTPLKPSGTGGAWNFLEQPADGDADLKRLIETKGESMPLLDKMINEGLNAVRGSQPRR